MHWCPSARIDDPDAVVLGVRSGPDGEVAYLAAPVAAADVVPILPPDIPPGRILRLAATCSSSCAHRDGEACGLIDRLVRLPSAAGDGPVPRCHLRPRCKWWHQAGVAACRRCPAVATAVDPREPAHVLAADPAATPEDVDAWMAAYAPDAD